MITLDEQIEYAEEKVYSLELLFPGSIAESYMKAILASLQRLKEMENNE